MAATLTVASVICPNWCGLAESATETDVLMSELTTALALVLIPLLSLPMSIAAAVVVILSAYKQCVQSLYKHAGPRCGVAAAAAAARVPSFLVYLSL